MADFNQAIQLNAGYVDAYVNRGFAHHLQNKFDLAMADYKQAIALNPAFAAAYFNLSLSQLAVGDYVNGWRNHEWRWKAVPSMLPRVFPEQQPQWMGQPLNGKTILLYAEQGLGDTLQFCRYIDLIRQLGARIVLEVPSELSGLLGQLEGVDRLIRFGESAGVFDFQSSLMSLPFAFQTKIDTIPCLPAYLRADVKKSAYWRKKLSVYQGLKVGLVWSGGFRIDQPELWGVNNRRNLPIHHLNALKNDHVDFFSLQKGAHAEVELSTFVQDPKSEITVNNFVSELHDFSDTAALIDNLDLVISVDTSTAHLAAALGKPVWILNRFDACWRWLEDRTDSPWYPSVKLYRQYQDGDWASVINKVTFDLSGFVSGHLLS